MSTPSANPSIWNDRADVLQRSLDHYYGAPWPQLLHNLYPADGGAATHDQPAEGTDTFNYWWLAHVIDARLDGCARRGSAELLAAAELTYRNILERNAGSLFNDYFDDMLWYALAIVRLHQATGQQHYLDDAVAIWEHVIEFGWNDNLGRSLAWRKQQLAYKNTPANGPLIILSCRLAQRFPDPRYAEVARTAFDWLNTTLVNPETGFVEDGINRQDDGTIDTQWRFTYNQGLYVGAAVELATLTGDDSYLTLAARTADTALRELITDGVFADENSNGDVGLFKGVLFRYFGLLVDRLGHDHPTSVRIIEVVRSSTDALWASSATEDQQLLLAGHDWRRPADLPVSYSAQLSAIMAVELRAALEHSTDAELDRPA